MEEVAASKLMVLQALKKKQQSRITNLSKCSLSARKKDLVCVTSGNSYLGSHIVKELLANGYPVRVTIQNQGTSSVSYINIYIYIYIYIFCGAITTLRLVDFI